MKFLKLSLVALILTTAACSGTKDKNDPTIDTTVPVETLYTNAARALDAGKPEEAIKGFQEIERLHPYSKWAKQAQLMAAYAYYDNESYDDAILALDRFIQLHPGHKSLDYAYYLKALSYYDQISDVARDQFMTEEALNAFNTLIRRFPDSIYTRDATLKRDLTLDHLAGKEMEIGRYYLNRGHVNAAINRFRAVVTDYQTTTHTAEALHRLVESYLKLGLIDQATKIASVLGYNYPGSPWYEKSYALLDDKSRQQILDKRGFIDRTVESLFKPE